MAKARRVAGFSLIELVVTILVAILLGALVQPVFHGLRQRAALRSSAEHALAFWNDARFESAKRNRLVKVGMVRSGQGFCLGAATTLNPADAVPCDCSQASPASNACNVARFPAAQSEWNGVSLVGLTLGGGASPADAQAVVIEPKRTALVVPSDRGSISFGAVSGRHDYRLNLHVDRFGRALVCESTSAQDAMSDFTQRRCAD